jgi:Relaxase/Mobilisation nuclease domain
VTSLADLSPAGLTASVGRHLLVAHPKAFQRLMATVQWARPDGTPDSGAVARGRNDEWEMDRPGEPRGAGAATRSMPNLGRGGRPAPSTRPASSLSLPAIGGGGTAPRSPMLAKANLAKGSQAAVVKLASYGSGPARAAALLNYQSHKGELTLERQDGTMIVGPREVADVAASWEGSNRASSNDVLSFKIRIDGPMVPAMAQTGLQGTLKGHDYAWTFAHDGAAAHIGVVMAAASSEHDDKGRLEWVYRNDRSIKGLHDRLETALGWPNAFSEPRWDHGLEGATTALARLTRGGGIEAFTPDGRRLREEANRIWEARPSAAGRSAPDNLNPSLEIAKSWAPNMRSRSPRDFAHVILSAKPGADKQAFMDAARATLAKEFAGHEYVFVMHTNRDHIHVHAAVRLTRSDGERLDPKIQHFARWRETLAHEARQRHIPMEAVRRFDQAHAPAYKLKDVRMVERGDAPDSVRRRIERVRDREVHRPHREEGWRRAQETAREWRALSSERSAAALPPAPDGALRLYRFERADAAHRNALFTSDRAIAESYARPGVSGRLVYIDVPADRIGELKPSHSRPDRLFVAPRSIAMMSIESEMEATVLSFRARVEAAIGESERSPPTRTNEARPMRSVETMTASRTRMADIINRMQAVLPDDEAARQFTQDAKQLLEKADRSLSNPDSTATERTFRATGTSSPSRRRTLPTSSPTNERATRSTITATAPAALIKPLPSSIAARTSMFAEQHSQHQCRPGGSVAEMGNAFDQRH